MNNKDLYCLDCQSPLIYNSYWGNGKRRYTCVDCNKSYFRDHLGNLFSDELTPNPKYWDTPLVVHNRLIEVTGHWNPIRIVKGITDLRDLKYHLKKGESVFIRGYGAIIARDFIAF